MTEEFNFKQELKEIFEKELLGKVTNAGRIYRKLRARDKTFIKKLKEEEWNMDVDVWQKFIEKIDKLAGDDMK